MTAQGLGAVDKVSKTGDLMTGDLQLPGIPALQTGAAPKSYIDGSFAGVVQYSGSWPPRPSTIGTILWIGPVSPPTTGAGAAVSGDQWLNTGTGGGSVASISAADPSIVIGGSSSTPTLRTGTLDVIATQHPPAGNVGMNATKLTNLANGSAAADSVALGQVIQNLTRVTTVTAATVTASPNQIIPTNTNSNAVAVTLPNAPMNGTVVAVKMVTQGAFNTTVLCAGSDTINSSSGGTSITLNLPGQGVILSYWSGIWTVLANGLPPGQFLTSQAGLFLPDGIAAAGGTNFGADAGHVHPATHIVSALPGSILGGNFPFWGISGQAAAAGTAGSNGTLYAIAVVVPANCTVTNVNLMVTSAGTSITSAYVGLMNSSGTVVATSTNRSADTQLTTSESLWAAPLSSTYPLTAPGIWYALALIVVGSAGTKPQLATGASGTAQSMALANQGTTSSAPRFAALSAQTSIAGPYTLSSMSGTALPFWCNLT